MRIFELKMGDVQKSEFCLFDFQGEFRIPNMDIDKLHLGKCNYIENGKIELRTNSLKINGQIERLKKPFLVLKRDSDKNLKIEAVLTEKYVFKKRPVFVLDK
ncbi:Chromosome transmission fidelity protein 8 [Bonamia ostreae]|uniref:Chromosome transmission fidelity protein 8 n=1 Tax=Bonamia ostreae TaxID=126728 RepID=A0ABV2AR38_9EUKA